VGKVFTTDVGTLIKLDTETDLGEATLVNILARKPSGDTVVLAATVVETTKVQHTKTALTLNVAGSWDLQAYARWTGGTEHYGEVIHQEIYPPIAKVSS